MAIRVPNSENKKTQQINLSNFQLEDLKTSSVKQYQDVFNENLVQLAQNIESKYVNENGTDILSVIADNTPTASSNETHAMTDTNDIDKVQEVTNQIMSIPAVPQEIPQVQGSAANAAARGYYMSWDPRIYRLDTFMLDTNTTGDGGIKDKARIPFASNTIASAFYNYNFVMPASIAQEYADIGMEGAKAIFGSNNTVSSNAESTNAQSPGVNGKQTGSASPSQKVIVNDLTPFASDSFFYGTQSLMNPFTMTKLMGGITASAANADNYMYDVRDKRRFYDVNNTTEDVLSISNPTVSQIINWANSDKWGRTPYSYQDFVFCEWFGKIPNNRLITLRRYHAPTYDNLQFESMYGDIEDKTTHQINPMNKDGKGVFSPLVTCVSYFGDQTGNSLNDFLKFTTGIPWTEITSDIYQVDGDEGTNPQAKMDQTLINGTMGGQTSEWDPSNSVMNNFGALSKRIVSYGKLTMAINAPVGIDEQLQDKLYAANNDPYEGIFKNRVLGPLNRIDKIYKRNKGITFAQEFKVKCSYKAKAIGGINPKAALLDILGNCMQMVSPSALFWGGGYRFMVKPHAYPYHDGGWRDNYLKKLYDGEILGDNGAIAFLAKGMKDACSDSDGNVSMDTITSNLGQLLGEGMSMIGSAINSLSSMFGGSGTWGNFLQDAGAAAAGKNKDEMKKQADDRISQLFGNINTMWHNRMLKESTLPQLKSTGSLLTGEPVGEWHLTIGNPLNPIMVVGNLICESMSVDWSDELGPDDFPTGMSVTYTLKHAMPRDRDAIQSMFNRGMGKFYELPDYMSFSSDMVTAVDHFTSGVYQNAGDSGTYDYFTPDQYKKYFSELGVGMNGYRKTTVSQGKAPSNHGNPNTQLITKFTPVSSYANQTLNDIKANDYITASNISVIKSLAATRKMVQ